MRDGRVFYRYPMIPFRMMLVSRIATFAKTM